MTESSSRPFRNPVAERADAFVRSIGLGKLAEPKAREPHILRWWPLALLILSITGYAVIAIAGPLDRHHLFIPAMGYAMLYLAFGVAGWLRMFGPRLIGALDERERMIKARAGHISGTIITVAAFLGCFYFAMAGPFGLWMPHVNEWVALAFLIETCWFTLPVLVASWLQPRPERD